MRDGTGFIALSLALKNGIPHRAVEKDCGGSSVTDKAGETHSTV